MEARARVSYLQRGGAQFSDQTTQTVCTWTALGIDAAQAINHACSIDFIHDQLEVGKSFRLFNVIDDLNCNAIDIEIDSSLPSERFIGDLKEIIAWQRKSKVIWCNNVTEYISPAIQS